MKDELTLLQTALIHPHIRELPEASLFKFERQSNEGRCRCRNELYLRRGCRLRCIVRNDLTLCRTREVRANAVEK